MQLGDVRRGVLGHKVNCERESYLFCKDSNLALQNLESSDTALLVFGNGDGGGWFRNRI